MVVPSTPATRQDTCKTDGSSIASLMDSGASKHYLDIDLHPELREKMLDYEILKEPHQIITAGEHVIGGIETIHHYWHLQRPTRGEAAGGVLSNSCT